MSHYRRGGRVNGYYRRDGTYVSGYYRGDAIVSDASYSASDWLLLLPVVLIGLIGMGVQAAYNAWLDREHVVKTILFKWRHQN